LVARSAALFYLAPALRRQGRSLRSRPCGIETPDTVA
jgi:hypothetical protein